MNLFKTTFAVIAIIAGQSASALHAQDLKTADVSASTATVHVNASETTAIINPQMLGGTNVALWNTAGAFTNPDTVAWMRAMHPALIRIPGGSWSDITYWNGNGVRDKSGNIDPTKMGADHFPAVDYSAYAPTFIVDQNTLAPVTTGSGNVDVKALHDYVESVGAKPYVCVNCGTGRPVDAAEWVRWANLKMHYGAHFWEVGNELDGGWEAGHVIPRTNETLTAQGYAERFHNFATAMKAIDPSIVVGGATTGVEPGGFTEAMLKYSGSDVGFVSIHTYSGIGGMTNDAALSDIDKTVAHEVGQVKQYIAEYQPDRVGKIPIGYSEYNIRAGSSDTFSGLWMAQWLSAMARNGVSFATQWDTYTQTRPWKDGQALILGDIPYVRKSEYFALDLWNNYTGHEILASDQTGQSTLRSFATRDANRVVVMLINPDKDRPADATIDLSGFHAASSGFSATMSNGTYFWGDNAAEPDWSVDPRISKIATGAKFTVTVPPLAVSYVVVPKAGSDETHAVKASDPSSSSKPVLKFFLPKGIYQGDATECWLEAYSPSGKTPYGAPLPAASIAASSGALLDRSSVRMAESIGRFVVEPTAVGDFTLTANVAGQTVSQTVTALSSTPHPVVFWDFTNPDVTDKDLFKSDWPLSADLTVRANKSVARVDLPADGATSSSSSQILLEIQKLPDDSKLNKSNIRGVVFDLKTSPNFSTDDPSASVEAVMQSPNNYWIVLGSVPLAGNSEWKSYQIPITDPKQVQFMSTTFNIWLILNANKPVKGSIYFDRAGLLVR